LEHQDAAPTVPPPAELRSELDVLRERQHEIPESLRDVVTQDRPIDFRPVALADGGGGTQLDAMRDTAKREPRRSAWFRTVAALPTDTIVHQAVLAYASDYGFLPTSLLPHGVPFRDPRLQLASLDHALWMHRPFKADEWLLYRMESPSASGARGFVRGDVFDVHGRLVASVAQEGLIRMKPA
jgi:acyl-CoA thioesterase-2